MRDRTEQDELETLRGDHCGLSQGVHGAPGCGRCIACARAESTAALALLRRIVTYATEDRARTPGFTRLDRALDEARHLLGGVTITQRLDDERLFECRCCSGGARGKRELLPPGWARIAGIDGPNAICPECRADPTALDAMKADGYENARIVGEVVV